MIKKIRLFDSASPNCAVFRIKVIFVLCLKNRRLIIISLLWSICANVNVIVYNFVNLSQIFLCGCILVNHIVHIHMYDIMFCQTNLH